MKLVEAVLERADLPQLAAQLEERLNRNLLVQENEAPSKDPAQLLSE